MKMLYTNEIIEKQKLFVFFIFFFKNSKNRVYENKIILNFQILTFLYHTIIYDKVIQDNNR